MQITITSVQTSLILPLEIPSDITVQDLIALIAADVEGNLPTASLHLYFNGQLLSQPNQTLTEAGIKDGDMLVLHTSAQPSGRRPPQPGPSQSSSRGRDMDPEMLRLSVLGDFRLMNNLKQQMPELADAVNDPARFKEVFERLERARIQQEREKQEELRKLEEDPFNPDSQRKIEEIIRKEAIQENLRNALEHHPESFGRVTMLYIDVEVNGTKVKAFVDSGAQSTIMSPDCAERCGIMRLVDTGFAGIARGVGTAKILGRVHSAQIKIGTLYLSCSFTVMEGKDVDLLLGLDMLKRFQAKLDLEKNVLSIQGQDIPFLGEADIPKAAWEREAEETVKAPSGAIMGASSGTVLEPPPASGSGSSSGGFQGQGRSLGPPPVQSPAPATQGGSRWPDSSIEQLTNLGFTREQAISAMDATNGNVDLAASLLFQ